MKYFTYKGEIMRIKWIRHIKVDEYETGVREVREDVTDITKQDVYHCLEALKNGKNIAVVPFTAGVGVEANEDLDRIALMIVKGISDVFEVPNYNFLPYHFGVNLVSKVIKNGKIIVEND